MDKKLLSTAEFAEKIGITQRSVARAIAEGRITSAEKIEGQWMIDEDQAVKEWRLKFSASATIPRSPEEASERMEYLKEHQEEITGPEVEILKSYFQALNLEFKYRIATNDYVLLESVKKNIANLVAEMNLILDTIPKKVYLKIAHMVTKEQSLTIESSIKHEIKQALISFCDKIEGKI